MINISEQGIQVCDIGCGMGVITHRLATMFPSSTFHGMDISPDAIHRAMKKENLPNLSFSVQDLCYMPSHWSESFDLIMAFDVIHDLPYASKGLMQIYR